MEHAVTEQVRFEGFLTVPGNPFNACWLSASGKGGIAALSMQRTLEIGSYQTAWAMLHRFRSVLWHAPAEIGSQAP